MKTVELLGSKIDWIIKNGPKYPKNELNKLNRIKNGSTMYVYGKTLDWLARQAKQQPWDLLDPDNFRITMRPDTFSSCVCRKLDILLEQIEADIGTKVTEKLLRRSGMSESCINIWKKKAEGGSKTFDDMAHFFMMSTSAFLNPMCININTKVIQRLKITAHEIGAM